MRPSGTEPALRVMVEGRDEALVLRLADDLAADRLQGCFPHREIVQIPARPLIQQYGSLHCLSMQFPRGVEFHTPTEG